MHPDLERLKSLQEADLEVRRLKDEIAALPQRVLVIEAKLAEERAAVERAKAALKECEKKRRDAESEIKSEQQKISKYRDQSLEVKTNEQYKSLMHEIEFSDGRIKGFEEGILQTMVEADAQEKALKTAEAELKAESVHIEKEKAEARERTQQDEKELAEWNAKRVNLRAEIGAEMLVHYDRIFSVRRPVIAEAIAHKCSACHVMVRPQKYETLRAGQQILTCDSCSRILFYDPAHEPVPEPPKAKTKKRKKPSPTEAAEEAATAETSAVK